MCLESSIGVRRLSTSFSNSFDMIGNKEKGPYEETSFTGFSGFGTVITSAAFHWVQGRWDTEYTLLTHQSQKQAVIIYQIPILVTVTVLKDKPSADTPRH